VVIASLRMNIRTHLAPFAYAPILLSRRRSSRSSIDTCRVWAGEPAVSRFEQLVDRRTAICASTRPGRRAVARARPPARPPPWSGHARPPGGSAAGCTAGMNASALRACTTIPYESADGSVDAERREGDDRRRVEDPTAAGSDGRIIERFVATTTSTPASKPTPRSNPSMTSQNENAIRNHDMAVSTAARTAMPSRRNSENPRTRFAAPIPSAPRDPGQDGEGEQEEPGRTPSIDGERDDEDGKDDEARGAERERADEPVRAGDDQRGREEGPQQHQDVERPFAAKSSNRLEPPRPSPLLEDLRAPALPRVP
jgi:hypothetical protein